MLSSSGLMPASDHYPPSILDPRGYAAFAAYGGEGVPVKSDRNVLIYPVVPADDRMPDAYGLNKALAMIGEEGMAGYLRSKLLPACRASVSDFHDRSARGKAASSQHVSAFVERYATHNEPLFMPSWTAAVIAHYVGFPSIEAPNVRGEVRAVPGNGTVFVILPDCYGVNDRARVRLLSEMGDTPWSSDGKCLMPTAFVAPTRAVVIRN